MNTEPTGDAKGHVTLHTDLRKCEKHRSWNVKNKNST